jgi:diadenosine tetraphosphate (Ap4A) HIT family hydrolase
MEALTSLGYNAAGMIPAAILNWIIYFNPSKEDHVHQMVSVNSDATTDGADTLHFYCYTCCTKYVLKVLRPKLEIAGNNCTCSGGPVHHLHTHIVSDKHIELSKTVIKIKCCLCKYYAILSCQSPPISINTIKKFIISLKQKQSEIDTLKILRNLLDEALHSESYEVDLNDTSISNICQNEYAV